MEDVMVVVTDDRQQQLTEAAESWPDKARALRVIDGATFERAGLLLAGIKALRKEAADVFGPVVKKAHEAHQAAKAAQNKVEQPLKEAESILKASLTAYHTEQERLANEERKRLAAEALARAEAEQLNVAVELEADGHQAAAEAVLAQPVVPAAVPAVQATPQVAGLSFREVWSAELDTRPGVKDEQAAMIELMQFIVANPAFVSLVLLDKVAANAYAKAQRSAMRIPGLRTKCTQVAASRAGR